MGQLVIPARAEGEIVAFDEGLSFWGGIDGKTGVIIDAYHAGHDQSLAGKIVMMPTSRGSCSGSGVTLELALNGCAPAAVIFREDEDVVTLGALVATRMFERPVAILRLSPDDYAAVTAEARAEITETHLIAGALKIPLTTLSPDDLVLSGQDRAMLDGAEGQACALAMQMLCTMAVLQGATRLIDVTRGHIDGCIYGGLANLSFAERMAEMGGKVRIPTTMNAISVDRENWQQQGVPPDFGLPASRLADAYTRMGTRSNFTCAPYYAKDPPALGENIGWSESNAVIFANTALGARTTKHPDFLDLFIALTGRAPLAGVYLPANRVARRVINVDLPEGYDDALWPLLGWLAGKIAPDRIPLLTGLQGAAPGQDDLRAICAAFGTTSAAPMLHVAGITPEGDMPPADSADHHTITRADLAAAWQQFNSGPSTVDLVALGSPHLSLEETRAFTGLLAGKRRCETTAVIVTLGRDIRAQAETEGVVAALEAAGVQVIPDICWCSITEPVFPPDARTLMTNSGKYAHYAPGLSGRAVRFGGLAACALAAQTGQAPEGLPNWLR
ncbi:aconitase X [Nioella sp.]|uniref:cis-3-hydroxy-L-proline dehydratase n=1 Tax=Nioella sp. TaxID=1912091 RepID=UPI003A856B45